MTLRKVVRRYRFYYKASSRALYRQAFVNHRSAWRFPFFGAGQFISRAGGEPVVIPASLWPMLPTASRLVLLGAQPSWTQDTLTVTFGGLTLAAPATSKLLPLSIKGLFVDDLFRINAEDLTNQTVLDVGAYIGDSSVAFALRGAHVHAFEPLARFRRYIALNAERNRLPGTITVHQVGLSDQASTIRDAGGLEALASAEHGVAPPCECANGEVRLVEAEPYCRENGIGPVDILKLNCEGCEYALFRNADLLQYLRPHRIIMEYHRGGDALARLLGERGYTVDWPHRAYPKGLMFADRPANSGVTLP